MRAAVLTMAVLLGLGASIHAASAQSAKSQEADDYAIVQRIGSRRAYEAFLRTYPTGPFADLARQELDKLPEYEPRRTIELPLNWGDDIFIPRLMEQQRQR